MNQAEPTSSRTYVPGFFRTKVALACAGLAIAGAGVAQLWEPGATLLAGDWAVAEVTAIGIERPDVAPEFVAVPRRFEEDPRRRAVYSYQVRVPGTEETLLLNVKNRVRPEREIGAAIRIVCRPGTPHAFSFWDLRTWAPGLFLVAAGGTFATAFAQLAFHSRRPIELPDDTPTNVPM